MRLLRTMALALALFSICGARAEEPESGDTVRVTVLEWIPLHAHTAVVNAFQEAWKTAYGNTPKLTLTRTSAYGDQKELDAAVAQLKSPTPRAVIAFGDYAALAVRKVYPDLPIIAVLARGLATESERIGGPTVIIDTEPDPQEVWKVAKHLRPQAKVIGCIHTDQYKPNIALANRLEAAEKTAGGRVVRILVDPGFCRTDSDFHKAIEKAAKDEHLDFLFVPEDPNCNRFVTAIIQAAKTLDLPVVGTEAMAGRGGQAVFKPDYASIAGAILKGTHAFSHDKPSTSIPRRLASPPRATFEAPGDIVK